MVHKLINGFTKEQVKALIRKNNTGEPCMASERLDDESGELVDPGFCVYFNPTTNNRCAVGCMLPDDFVQDNADKLATEELSATGLLLDYPELKQSMPLAIEGLCQFQTVHDTYLFSPSTASLHDTLCAWIDENTEEVK